MPQGEEGTVYWSNDDDKTTEQQSATRLLSSLWKWSPAAGQMEWNLFFWISKTFLNCICHQSEFDLVYVSKPRNYADNKPPIHVSDKILSQNLHVFLFYFLLGHLRLTGDTYH